MLEDQDAPAVATQDEAPAYDPAAIEKRWQRAWRDAEVYRTLSSSDSDDQTAYIATPSASLAAGTPLDLIRSYSIADAYARFSRARGLPTLLSLGFDAFGAAVEDQATGLQSTPAAWIQSAVAQRTDQFRRFGFSLDFSRVFCSSESDTYRFSQELFLILLEKGLIDRTDSEWRLRLGAYLQRNDERLSGLQGWTELALASQQAIPGSVDGVEFDVVSVDGTPLTVFTPHERARKQAEFIAISPNHPDIEQWVSSSDMPTCMDEAVAAAPDSDPAAISIDTGRLVSGVGTENPLPVIVSPAVDMHFGPTAVLGIPAVEPADAALAKQIQAPAVSPWRITDNGPSSVRPAHRYNAHTIPLSQPRAWGTPIPVIRCEACGAVPVPVKDLPVLLPDDLRPTGAGNALQDNEDFLACTCPSCSAPARRETDTLDPYFDRLWQWLAPCLNPADRNTLLDDPQLDCWLPARQAILGADDGGLLFDRRAGVKALRDCGLLSQLDGDEPFASATMHARVKQVDPKERIHLDGLIKHSGADALRLTLLFAAAPSTVLPWSGRTLQYCRGWLSSFWSYALPRLQALEDLPEIDDRQGAVALQVRLARWSHTAVDRVTENLEDLHMHRAVRNVMTLQLRIEDLEQRVIDQYGDLTPADSKAIAEALLIAVQLLAPLAPHIAEELWAAAEQDGFVAAASWPEIEPLAS